MISKVNPYVLDRRTQNVRYTNDKEISRQNYPVGNYLFNLIDCTRKFTNEPILGSMYEGRYFKSDNFKTQQKDNDKNRQKKYYRNNNNSNNMKNNNEKYFYSKYKNTINESEKEKQIKNNMNKHPYVVKSLEKTNKKNNNNPSNTQQITTSYIRPDQLPTHKFLKITYDKKFNNSCYIPSFLREPSLEAMEAMNNVLYGNMLHDGKNLR